MIEIIDNGKTIRFTPRDTERGKTLQTETRPLVYGYRCPNCSTVIQALFRGESEIKWEDYSQQTTRHAVLRPPYLDATKYFDDQSVGQYLLEKLHSGLTQDYQSGRCKYNALIYKDGPFEVNQDYYARRLADVLKDLSELSEYNVKKVKRYLKAPNGDQFRTKLFEIARLRLGQSVDTVNGAGTMWLFAKYDWGWRWTDELNNLFRSMPNVPEEEV